MLLINNYIFLHYNIRNVNELDNSASEFLLSKIKTMIKIKWNFTVQYYRLNIYVQCGYKVYKAKKV